MLDIITIKKQIGLLKAKKKIIFLRNFWSTIKSFFKTSNIKHFNKIFTNKNIEKKNILICTLSGDNFLIKMIDILFYYYFRCLGHKVNILKCGKSLDLCMVSDYSRFKKNKISFYHEKICKFCNKGFETDFKNSLYAKINLGNYIKEVKYDDNLLRENYIKYSRDHLNEIIKSATIRFLGKSSVNFDSKFEKNIFNDYEINTHLFIKAFENILNKYQINLVINHHGIYFPHGVINLLTKYKKIDNYTWAQGYRKNSIIVLKNNNIHKFFNNLKSWDNFDFDNQKKNTISNYLKERETGKEDWVKFQSKKKYNIKNVFNNKNETYFLPTNVSWDAQLHFPKNIFKNLNEFIFCVIDYFIRTPQKNLILRCHPGELLSQVPSNERVSDIIKTKYDKLPNNIKIFDSIDSINSYSLSKEANVAIVYASKMSIELAATGMPVICCGEAWIKNKDITFDPNNINEFYSYLDEDVLKLKNTAKNRKDKALKFAYYYFFIKMVKLNLLKKSFFPKLKIEQNYIQNDKKFLKIIENMLHSKEIENI